MDFSEKDMKQLKALHGFLITSFKGASIGQLKVDDLTKSLSKAIDELEKK